MKWAMSVDGIERTNVHVVLRFSREEIAQIRRLAKEQEMGLNDWCAAHAQLGVEGELISEDGSYEQRYGKGEG